MTAVAHPQEPATGRALGLSLAGVAALLTVLGVVSLVVGGVLAMSLVLPLWAAALVGAASLFVAAALVAVAAHHQVAEADARSTGTADAPAEEAAQAPREADHAASSLEAGEVGPTLSSVPDTGTELTAEERSA